ncbi:hypothetical protein CDD83_2825 [Cordyceps sp. RAO-2017]|nr:hypothetical protein CDD83_2825 [Cordyceps sp. RAO-2017]
MREVDARRGVSLQEEKCRSPGGTVVARRGEAFQKEEEKLLKKTTRVSKDEDKAGDEASVAALVLAVAAVGAAAAAAAAADDVVARAAEVDGAGADIYPELNARLSCLEPKAESLFVSGAGRSLAGSDALPPRAQARPLYSHGRRGPVGGSVALAGVSVIGAASNGRAAVTETAKGSQRLSRYRRGAA